MSASPVFSSAATSRPFIFSPWSSPRPSLRLPGRNVAGNLAETITDIAADTAADAKADADAKAKAKKTAQILAHVGASLKLAKVVPASRLEARSTPEMVSSGIPQLDSLIGGFPRGCLSEIFGTASSGRTSVLLLALARATQRGEVCALVDASDAFDPASAAAAGMQLNRLLWVRCGEKYSSRNNKNIIPSRSQSSRQPVRDKKEDLYQGMPLGIPQVTEKTSGFSGWQSQLAQLLKVTDLLLQSNGFGMIALDLGDIPAQSARRISLASWFRFRRAIEHTPTALLVLEQQPIAGSCSSILLKVSGKRPSAVSHQPSGNSTSHPQPSHSELLDQLEITAELQCSRFDRKSERKFERKPVQSTTSFQSRAEWAG